MFHIGFFDADNLKGVSASSPASEDQDDPFVCPGEITLGSFVERFECVLDFWRKEDYELHWRTALSRLVAGSGKTAIITSMSNPEFANFLTWWPLYREQQTVFVQNHLLFLDQLPRPFSLETIDDFVMPRSVIDDEGNRISEWTIPLADVEHFLR